MCMSDISFLEKVGIVHVSSKENTPKLRTSVRNWMCFKLSIVFLFEMSLYFIQPVLTTYAHTSDAVCSFYYLTVSLNLQNNDKCANLRL